jgi:hypothetical protein
MATIFPSVCISRPETTSLAHQATAVGKCGIQIAVGIEPGQAARNRRAVSIGDAAHHDLPVQLESDCLWLVLRPPARIPGGV